MDWRRHQVGRLFGPAGECRRAGCPAASVRHWLFCRIGWQLGRSCSLEATVDITVNIAIIIIVAGCSGWCWLIASTIESEDRLRSAFSPACCPVSDSRHLSSVFHCWYLPFHFEFGSWLGSFGCLHMLGFWIQSKYHLKQLVSIIIMISLEVLVLAFYRWNQMYYRPWLGYLSVTSSSIKYSIKAGLCLYYFSLTCHLVLDFEQLGFWVHFVRWQESASWLIQVKAEKHC